MVWVKTEVSDHLNQCIETVQEQYNYNKPQAVLYLLAKGAESHFDDYEANI